MKIWESEKPLFTWSWALQLKYRNVRTGSYSCPVVSARVEVAEAMQEPQVQLLATAGFSLSSILIKNIFMYCSCGTTIVLLVLIVLLYGIHEYSNKNLVKMATYIFQKNKTTSQQWDLCKTKICILTKKSSS